MPLPFRGESYFDIPDGERVEKKLWIAVKNTALISACISAADVLLYSHPKGYLATLGRIGYLTGPMIGMTTAFVVFSNSATTIRKKDDPINWVIGATAAGVVCGAWKKSGMVGFCSSILFSVLAFAKKDALMHNYTMFPEDHPHQNGGSRSVRQDWTITAHRPGNWVR